MSDAPAEVTNRLADYLIDRYGLDEAMRLIPFYFGRTEFGDDKYGRPLLPFDGRNTLRDALDEVTDLSQYLMKRVMENEAIADLLEQAATRIEPHYGHTPEDVNGHPHPRVCVECTENMYTEDGEENWTDEQVEYWLSMDPVATELRQTAAKLRADCERSVPVGNSSKNSNSPEIPDGCLFGDECCAILGPAEQLAQMEGES